MSIALLGTRGVPARYGGFETAIEEVGQRLVERGHAVRVYCRGDGPTDHLGMRLVHLPAVRAKTVETLSHTALSAAHLVAHRTDVAILFNAANAPFIPPLRARGIPVAAHVDGLEWQRTKWGGAARRYYRLAERMCVRWADVLIADAEGIRQYYGDAYGADPRLISYGAPILTAGAPRHLARVGVTPRGYHLVVARLERENNVHAIIEGYRRSRATLPLLVVGSSPYASPYHEELRAGAGGDPCIRFVGAVWDQDLLNELYAHCSSYVHGHSVGGTNPSLLRAMGAGAPVVAFDVVFNREVAADTARFFADPAGLASHLEQVEADPAAARLRGEAGRTRVAALYRWDRVTDGYEDLCATLAGAPPEQVVSLRDPPAAEVVGDRLERATPEPITSD